MPRAGSSRVRKTRSTRQRGRADGNISAPHVHSPQPVAGSSAAAARFVTDFETALKRRRHIIDTLTPHIVVQNYHAKHNDNHRGDAARCHKVSQT